MKKKNPRIEEIRFTDLKVMVDAIKLHTKENFAYVEQQEDPVEQRCGWICIKTGTSFYIDFYYLERSGKQIRRYLDSPLKRKLACIPLSHCSTDKEYNILKEKLNKLKIFW